MVEYTHDIFLTRAEVVRRRSMSFIKEYAQKLVTAEEAVMVGQPVLQLHWMQH